MSYEEKRHRRNEHPCVLCKADTHDWDHICHECRKIYQAGQDRIAAAHAGKETQVWLDRHHRLNGDDKTIEGYVSTPHYDSDRPHRGSNYDNENDLWSALDSLIGEKREHNRELPNVKIDPKSEAEKDIREPFQKTSHVGYAWCWSLTEAQAGALEALILAIRRHWAFAHAEGYDKGNRMIRRLATGDLSIAQINEWQTMEGK